MVTPAVKATTKLLGPQQHLSQSSVSPGEHPLQNTLPGFVPFEVQSFLSQTPFEKGKIFFYLGQGELGLPLKWGMRFRDKGGDTNMQPTRWFVCGRLPPDFHGKCHQSLKVFSPFGGQTHHKVEFDEAPACGIDLSRRIQQVAFADSFVDHAPQSLASRLWGQGKSGFSHLADRFNHLLIQRSYPKTRQRDGYLPIAVGLHQGLKQPLNITVITNTESQQRQFVMAGAGQPRLGQLQNLPRRSFSNWPINKAGLTETTATRTSTRCFQTQPVVNDAGTGNQRAARRPVRIQS